VYTGRNLWGETEMHKYKLRIWDGQREYFGNLQMGSDSDVVDYREGDDDPISVRKLTGLRKYTNITLKRGYTQDSSAFSAWAAAVAGSTSSGSGAPSHSFHGSLELSDEAGRPIVRFSVHGSSLTEHQLISPGGVTLHHLDLRNGKTVEEKLWEILEESLSRGH